MSKEMRGGEEKEGKNLEGNMEGKTGAGIEILEMGYWNERERVGTIDLLEVKEPVLQGEAISTVTALLFSTLR
ncbi:Hypothetical predicted protein [Octopus vulgaris]|uniref:Uncharacterized protein n=1 Tax=Octopus vulgaris TaxID=6645 RepID=A0AA36ALB2_OCTVU|nr:Hypothetical predicted protein [Octopus vulgaris]